MYLKAIRTFVNEIKPYKFCQIGQNILLFYEVQRDIIFKNAYMR